MNLLLTDIYNAFRDSVRYYPAQDTLCKRLQTWRVFQQSLGVEVSTANLGATVCDKDKPYFWSREWHEKKYNPNAITWKFPLLYAFETEGTMVGPFGFGGAARMVYTLQVGVLDVLVDTKDARNCVGCNARTPNEIYADTETMLLSALYFVSNVNQTEIDGVSVWANSDLVSQGEASGALNVTGKTAISILDQSQKYNQEAPFFRVERSAEKMYGTAINLRVATQVCPSVDWNFTETDFGVLAQEAGCKTC
jgi:hypothetical protein